VCGRIPIPASVAKALGVVVGRGVGFKVGRPVGSGYLVMNPSLSVLDDANCINLEKKHTKKLTVGFGVGTGVGLGVGRPVGSGVGRLVGSGVGSGDGRGCFVFRTTKEHIHVNTRKNDGISWC
jgi:hypothetical protein